MHAERPSLNCAQGLLLHHRCCARMLLLLLLHLLCIPDAPRLNGLLKPYTAMLQKMPRLLRDTLYAAACCCLLLLLFVLLPTASVAAGQPCC